MPASSQNNPDFEVLPLRRLTVEYGRGGHAITDENISTENYAPRC